MKRYGGLWEQVGVLPESSGGGEGGAAREAIPRLRPRVPLRRGGRDTATWRGTALARVSTRAVSQLHDRGPEFRLISAAPYRDRVVHHALVRVIEPVFERSFIDDSYACRDGKGNHAAMIRAYRFLRASRYVLKCDIALDRCLKRRRRFPSADRHVFVSHRGAALPYRTVHHVFGKLLKRAGIRGESGRRAIVIHDFRHTICVRALLRCPEGRDAVAQHTLAVSTYVGCDGRWSTFTARPVVQSTQRASRVK